MFKNILSNNKSEILIFFLILLSRVLIANYSDSFHSMDCVNYILAVEDYNIPAERPHLPGYIIYVVFFKFLTLFLPNGNPLFIVFQGIFQAISAVIIFKIIKNYFENINPFYFIIFLFSIPTVYFFGIVSEIYSIDILIISVYLLLFHKKKVLWLLPYIGFIAGIRQSSGGMLLPSVLVYIFFCFKEKELTISQFIKSGILSIFIILAWFIPLIQTMGGLTQYLIALEKQKELIVSYKLYNNIISFLTYSFFYLFPLFFVIILSKFREKFRINQQIIFYLSIIIPQLILFIFYHYNKGYALLLLPPLLLVIFNNLKINKKVIISISIIQLLFFYFYPGKIPSFNTQLLDKYRNISKYETWYQRFQYWWLPSLDANLKTVELHNEFEKNKNKIFKILNGKKLLIDYSVIIRARNLAYIAPEMKICEILYPYESSYEQYYQKVNFSVHTDLVENFENFYILVEKEYYSLYLKDVSTILYETKFNYLIQIDSKYKIKYIKQCRQHFIG